MPIDRKNTLQNPYSSWDDNQLKKRHLELLASDPNYQSLISSKVMPGTMGSGLSAEQRTSDDVPRRSLGTVASDMGLSLARGVVQAGDAAIGLANLPTGGHAGRLLENITGYKSGELDESLSSRYSPAQQEANRRVAEAEGFLGTVGTALQNPSSIVHAVLESTPSMIGGGLIGRGLIKAAPKLSAWAAGAIGEGTVQAGAMAEEVRQESEDGTITGKQAFQSIGSGIGTGAFGFVGARIARKFGVGDIDTWLAGGSLTTKAASAVDQPVLKSVREVASRITAGGISEGIFEELPQSLQEQVWMNAATSKALGENVGEAGAMGMLAGAAMGGGFSIFTQPKVLQDAKDIPDTEFTEDTTKPQFFTQEEWNEVINKTDLIRTRKEESQQKFTSMMDAAQSEQERQQLQAEALEEEAYWNAEAARFQKELKERKYTNIFETALKNDYEGTLHRYVNNPELLAELPIEVQENFLAMLQEPLPTNDLVSNLLTQNQRVLDLAYEEDVPFEAVVNDFAELTSEEQERIIRREQSALALIRRQQQMAQITTRKTLQEIEAEAALDRFANRIETHLPNFIEIAGQTKEEIPILEGPEPGKILPIDYGEPDPKRYDPFAAITRRLGGKIFPRPRDISPEAVEGYDPNLPVPRIGTNYQHLQPIATSIAQRDKMLRNPLTMEIEAANNNVDVETFRRQLISDNISDRATLNEFARQADQATPLTERESQEANELALQENQTQVQQLMNQFEQADSKEAQLEIHRQLLSLLEQQKELKKNLAPQSVLDDLSRSEVEQQEMIRQTETIPIHYTPQTQSIRQKYLPKAQAQAANVKEIMDRKTVFEELLSDIKDQKKRQRLEKRLVDPLLGEYGVTNKTDFEETLNALESAGVDYILEAVDGGNLGGINAFHQDVHARADADIKQVWGDVLTRTVQDFGGAIYRTGGDEFRILWPGYTKAEVTELRNDIEAQMRNKMAELGIDKIGHPKHGSLPTGALYTSYGFSSSAEHRNPNTGKVNKGDMDREAELSQGEMALSYIAQVAAAEGKQYNPETKAWEESNEPRIVESTTGLRQERRYSSPGETSGSVGPAQSTPNITPESGTQFEPETTEGASRSGLQVVDQIIANEAQLDSLMEQLQATTDKAEKRVLRQQILDLSVVNEKLKAGETPQFEVRETVYVKDSAGNDLIGYHGTAAAPFKAFDNSKIQQFEHGWAGAGHYFTLQSDYAQSYGETNQLETGQPARVAQARFSFKNPLYKYSSEYNQILEDTLGTTSILTKADGFKATEAFKAAGYDAVIEGRSLDNAFEINVFDSKNIHYAPGQTEFEVRENRVPGQGIQLSDIQAVFQGQDVFQTEDGQVSVRFKNGKSVTFQNIQDAGSGYIHFAVSTGQMSKDGKILGITIGNNILLDKDFADNFTLWHENKHVLDNLGMITPEDNSVLIKEFNKLRETDQLEFALSTHEDPKLALQENLANTFAQVMTQRAAYRNTPLGKLIQRVMDFFNQLFAFGQQSLSGLAREVESGKIYSREVNGQTYNTIIPQTEVAANKWYSTVSKAINSSNMQSAKGLAWLNQIKKYPNVKDDELEWTGLKDYLTSVGQDKISKKDLQAWFNDNQIQIEEVIKQDISSKIEQLEKQKQDLLDKRTNLSVKAIFLVNDLNYKIKYDEQIEEFSLNNPDKNNRWYPLSAFNEAIPINVVSQLKQYQNQIALYNDQIFDLSTEIYNIGKKGPTKYNLYKTNMGEDYKEFILTFPAKGKLLYTSSHWGDIQNPVVHIRSQVRADADGNNVLHIEEVQSDWDQDLSKKGKKDLAILNKPFKNLNFEKENQSFYDQRLALKEKQQEEKKILKIKDDILESYSQAEQNIFLFTQQREKLINQLREINRATQQNLWQSTDKERKRLDRKISDNKEDLQYAKKEYANILPQASSAEKRIAQINNELKDLQEERYLWKKQNKEDLALLDLKEEKKQGVARNPWSEKAVLLAMKRMVRYAAENGYSKILWSGGDIQTQRWGSEGFSWTRNEDGSFTLKAKEQVSGEIFAGMEEELAREVVDITERVTSRDEVRDVIARIMDRKKAEFTLSKYEEYLDRQADKLWKQMQPFEVAQPIKLDNLNDETALSYIEQMENFYNNTKQEKYFILANEAIQAYEKKMQQKLNDAGFSNYMLKQDFNEWAAVKNYMTVATGATPQEAFDNANITKDKTGFYFPRKEGMEAFYDKELPNMLKNFFGKGQWGKAKVGKEIIDGITFHSLEITDRMRAKALREGMPQFQVVDSNMSDLSKPTRDIPQAEYDRILAKEKNIVTKFRQIARMTKTDAKMFLERMMAPISTRLMNINPVLAYKLRRLSFDTSTKAASQLSVALPIMEALKNMPKNDSRTFDWAVKNGDINRINFIASQYGFTESYQKLRGVLDQVRRDAIDVGYDVGYIENYWPRVLKDQEGFLQATKEISQRPIFSDALKDKAQKLGITVDQLSPDLRADIISNIILGVQNGIGGPGNIQGRVFDFIPEDYSEFYMDAGGALMQYIYSMNKKIAARKFFGRVPERIGKAKKNLRALETRLVNYQDMLTNMESDPNIIESNPKAIADLNQKIENITSDMKHHQEVIEDYKHRRDYTENISSYVSELLAKNMIKESDELTLKEILNARFHEKGTTGIVHKYKNAAYIDTMGSPFSALTQIGDLAWAYYVGGLTPSGMARTTKNLIKAVRKKSEITKEDLGIERIAQEFADADSLSNAVSWVFKKVGLERIDSIGKETLINTAHENYKERAKDPQQRSQLKKEIQPIFGKETEQVINDLIGDNISDNVKMLVYSKLLDFQPVALSEMPEWYLNSGNGRIFYMLKTYTMKQLDVYRREVYQQMSSKDPEQVKQGMKNMITLTSALVLANAGADELKDFIAGKESKFEDHVIENFLTLGGASRYMQMQVRREGVGSALVDQILPPFKFVDSISRDVLSGVEDGVRSVESIPIAGKLYYWHYGRGSENRPSINEQEFKDLTKDVKKFKKKFEDAKDKRLFLQSNLDQFRQMKQVEKFQTILNKNKTLINKLKDMEQTTNVRKRISQLEQRREMLYQQFFQIQTGA